MTKRLTRLTHLLYVSLFLSLLAFTICFIAPGTAGSMDTEGENNSWPDKCDTPYLQSHSISADGKTKFIFQGQCYRGKTNDIAVNLPFFFTATWDGSQAMEIVTISGKTGTVISACPSDPWLNKVTCQKKSVSGDAFVSRAYPNTGLIYPLTARVLTDAQRAQLQAELEEKKKEVACVVPVVLSPLPTSGSQFKPPASVKISIKHSPGSPPKEWIISWAPLTKPGDWPAASTQQNMTLSHLTTSGEVTTGTFNTSKPGLWQISSKVYFPSYCNRGNYASVPISFMVVETSLTKPGPGPIPSPNVQQKQTVPFQKK
jgi:hypothetical protein